MTAENFAYWLQGLLELNPDLKTLDEKQVKMIREHLGLVMTKVTGKLSTNFPLGPYTIHTIPYQPSPTITVPSYPNPFSNPTIICSTQEGQNQCSGTVADSVMTTYC